MSTGLFKKRVRRVRPPNIDDLVAKKKRKADVRFLKFVEMLSEHDAEAGDPGGSLRVISERMGLPYGSAVRYLRRLKEEMGPQAEG